MGLIHNDITKIKWLHYLGEICIEIMKILNELALLQFREEGTAMKSDGTQARTQDFQKGGSDCGTRRSKTRGSGGAAPRR